MTIQRDFVKENLLDQVDELVRRMRVLEETVFTIAAFVGAKYQTNAGNSISDATVTIVDYEDEVYDTHDAVTTGASWKFTAPLTGYYHISAAVRFTGTTAWAETENAQLHLYKNGSGDSALAYVWGQDSSGGNEQKQMGGAATTYLSAGDYIDVRVYQESGAALALNTVGNQNYVCIEKVG